MSDTTTPAPQPETAQQRRERLALVLFHCLSHPASPLESCRRQIDLLVASDRVAGCDPGALRAEVERGRAARQEVSAIAKAVNWRYDGTHQKSLAVRVVAAIEREERLEAERDALAARLAVVAKVAECGRWEAFVADTHPKAGNRILRTGHSFPTEAEALEAARAMIDRGWVAEYLIDRASAKPCASYSLPRDAIDRLGRALDGEPRHD